MVVFLLSKFGIWQGMLWKTLHAQLVRILAMLDLLLLAGPRLPLVCLK